MRPTVWRVLLAALLVAGAGLAAASPAAAHATLVSTTPAAGAALDRAPTTVTVHFDDDVTLVPGSLTVIGPDGSRVDAGQPQHPLGHAGDVVVRMHDHLAAGGFLASWRVVSDDGHAIHGSFRFSLGSAGRAPAAAVGPSASSWVGGLLAVARLIGFVGLALLLGGALFLSVCWKSGWASPRARRVLGVGWCLLAGATAVELIGKGADDAGTGLSGFARPDLVREVLDTSYGSALLLRLVGVVLVALWWVLRHRVGTSATGRRVAGGLLGALLLVSFALAGHASSGAGQPLALVTVTAHLAAMAAWLGGLAMLPLVLLVRSGPQEPGAVVARFSRLSALAVAVLAVTGVYLAVRQVGSLDALPSTAYGRLLLTKLALVLVLLGVAAQSRGWVRRHYSPLTVVHAVVDTELPQRAARPAPPGPQERAALRRSVVVEAVLAVAVLAVTAVLVATQPARSAYQPADRLQPGAVTQSSSPGSG